MTTETRSLCVLFADVVGSSRLYDKLGDTEALHAVEQCLSRMERATVSFGGRVIKTIGDEILTVFDTVEVAVHAACEMQVRIDDLPPIAGDKLEIRVGFHYGPTLLEGNDIFGDTVNTAARIASVARGRQILASATSIAELPAGLRKSATRALSDLSMKGKEAAVPIAEVIWQPCDEMTMTTLGSLTQSLTGPARLHLRFGENELQVECKAQILSLGRDIDNDVQIPDSRASRKHGRIECRQDKFVLVDQSSNGTFVSIEGMRPFALRREEVVLRGKGRICLGHVCKDEASDTTLYFEVIG